MKERLKEKFAEAIVILLSFLFAASLLYIVIIKFKILLIY